MTWKKRFITLSIALLIGLAVLCSAYVTVGTTQRGFLVLRAEADEDTALDLTTKGDFANKPATALELKGNLNFERGVQNIAVAVCGGDAANDTFSWRWLAWSPGRGPAKVLGNGTGILGTQAVVKYPHDANTATDKFWADTLTVTNDYTTTGIYTTTAGGNSVAELATDLQGYNWTMIEITGADGSTGIEAGDVTVYYREF